MGFITTAKSIIAISRNLLSQPDNRFEYVLTYRFSQDALEMFFSKIRGRFGWNNNPNVLEFKYALRALLQENKIDSPETANCVMPKQDSEPSQDLDLIPADKSPCDPRVYWLLNTTNIWRYDALYYISGYIAKRLIESIKCPECAVALYEPQKDTTNASTLLSFKSHGSLFIPSSSTMRVVQETDKVARELMINWQNMSKKVVERLSLRILERLRNRVFLSLQQHSMETHKLQEMEADHITALIKSICQLYMKIFIYQFSKVHTERVVKANRPSTRHKLLKTVLFYND